MKSETNHVKTILKNTAFCVLPTAAMACVLYVLFVRAMNSISPLFIRTSYERYLIFFICCIVVLVTVKSKIGFRVFVGVLIGFYAFLAVYNISYSHIDEAAHFECINYIITHKRLPTTFDYSNAEELNKANDYIDNIGSTPDYEAVQAPVYYLGMAFVGWFFKSIPLRFRVLRLLSYFFVLLGLVFLKKTVDVLIELGLYQKGKGEVFLRLLLLITVFSPGYMVRAIRLNNESLLCFLLPMLLYVGVRCIKEGYSAKAYWLMSAICFTCFMTKSTALYVYVVIGLIALYQRKILKAILPVLAGVPLIAPWLIFNYRVYGHLTGMAEHIAFVTPIINPNHEVIDLVDSFMSLIGPGFWFGEEVTFTSHDTLIMSAVFIVGVICLAVILVREVGVIITGYRNGKRSGEEFALSARTQVNLLCIGLLAAATVMLSAGAIGTMLSSLRGRYFHGAASAVVILGCVNYRYLTRYGEQILSALLAILCGALLYETLVFCGTTTCKQHNLYASQVKVVQKEDITDETWTHGISADGLRIAVPAGTDYSPLTDRFIMIGDQESLIVGVGSMGGTETVDGTENETNADQPYLELGMAVDVEQAGSVSELYLGDHMRWKVVNGFSGENAFYLCGDGKEFSQTCEWPGKTTLYRLGIFAGTYLETIPKAEFTLKITDASGNVLVDKTVVKEEIPDNEWIDLDFDEPVIIEKDTKLTIELLIRLDKDHQMALYCSPNNRYKGGELTYDGNKEKDIDLVFRVMQS